ncbi:MAG: alpha-glucan family phosphorylase [Saprospiraceae bacterium]|nr:alpha-glucan family phosphorylase [Lewinella sp.]
MIGELKDTSIKLKRIFIETQLSKELEPLNKLANNIWWSWNQEAIELFSSIAPERFVELNYNPLALLKELDTETSGRLMSDKSFLQKLKKVEKDFDAYMKVKPANGSPKIAYFSMEYGLHISLKLYSGGLGVLAGDYLKEASDDNSNMIAVGLLYRYGYFTQGISIHGDQVHNYPPQEFTKLPIEPVRTAKDEWLKIAIDLPGRQVFAKIWQLNVGRVPLYLLDTDFDENSWEDRTLTHQLYGGDNDHRLKQEILLGIGGIRVLTALGIEADIYHCNEGHAAFNGLERLKDYVQKNSLSNPEALETVRSTSLFTTHTPVPAGHDYFQEDQLRTYLHGYVTGMGMSWEDFMALGRKDRHNIHEQFSMSHLAIRMSQEVNGVSKLHGLVSQNMFKVLYPGYTALESHIGYVTNSVHYPTWIAPEWNELYIDTFGTSFLRDQANKAYWRKIQQVPDKKIMEIRRLLKRRLLDFVREKIQADFTKRGDSPRVIFDITKKLDENALVFGFARRFATYKRAHLLFSNTERLAELVNNPSRPVIFLFAGKAHPADGGGQGLIRHILNISKQPEFQGKIIFLENYNMEMAKLLVQGVDVWLNTPTRPLEASGTSGMKAALNGVMNFSVLDGWWAEGYRDDAGWALPLERTFAEQNLQDELDAESIYNILEQHIIPTYYQQDADGISAPWVQYIKNIIAEVAPDFTMQRMLHDYYDRFYLKLFERGNQLRAKKFAAAIEIAHWKEKMTQAWDAIEVVDAEIMDTDNHALPSGKAFEASIKVFLGNLKPEEVGMEVVFYKRKSEDELVPQFVHEMSVKNRNGHTATYTCKLDPKVSGVYEYGFRIFPKHPLLAHRQDLNLVHWV